MPVHLGCALQQVGKGIPAERERGGKADRRPQRIAPAERLAERQDTGFVDPPFHCAVGAGGQRDEATDRVDDTGFVEPLQRRIGVEQRSEEHTSELQSLMRISYAVLCLKKKKTSHIYKIH